MAIINKNVFAQLGSICLIYTVLAALLMLGMSEGLADVSDASVPVPAAVPVPGGSIANCSPHLFAIVLALFLSFYLPVYYY